MCIVQKNAEERYTATMESTTGPGGPVWGGSRDQVDAIRSRASDFATLVDH